MKAPGVPATMSKTFEQGKEEIVKLCQYFSTNHKAFLVPAIKEAHVRQSLIDPLFQALGWDVANKSRLAPQYREVIPEDSLDVEGHQKAPDYTFRVGTLAKFYVEAKKCGININSDPAPAYQLRRYGWSAKVALSILTDFEELAVYDCTFRPRPTDKASRGRIQYFNYKEYPDRWRELWDIFSHEAIWDGRFDQYAASKRKRGTSEVDVEFLKEIEGWRDTLARNIALRNKELSSDDLNAAVQLTIDRLVFLRMAEDRALEHYQQLLKLCERPKIYERFMRELCHKADQKYNSGLFHFQKESGVSEEPDRITPKLTLDDKVFKPILQSLYFEHGSPYHFGVLPVEILGTVYERFLGKVIRLTKGHQAKIEEKPEVRKAGGVYYTPAYIVSYIVKHTVGTKIKGKSPGQLAGGKSKPPFRVLDMACGSGSFLLGAYQCLLDHCLKWYTEHSPEKKKKAVYKDPRDKHWRLRIEEKKRILTAHIFGVDIDSQAAEVSKLSLLLKVLEGETDQSVAKQMRLFHERALPNLADNIKCGNSLIGPDYFTGTLIPDPEEIKRVNPFDWQQGFPNAMEAGGFDCIIGNPPYIRIQMMKEWAPLEVEIYKERFRAAAAGNYDIYVVFIEQGLKLLNSNGQLGFICPHKFFNSKYGKPLRTFLAQGQHLAHIVHFGAQQVFDGATTYTCLVFLNKSPISECYLAKVDDLASWRMSGTATEGPVKASQINGEEWNFSVGPGAALFAKMSAMPHKLTTVAQRIFQGFKTGADPVFILDCVCAGRFASKCLDREVGLEPNYIRPLFKSGQFKRYCLHPTEKIIIFPYKDGSLVQWSEIERNAPKTAHYLRTCKQILEQREGGRWAGPLWYCYSRTQALEVMSSVKILTADLNPSANYCFDSSGDVCFTGGAAGGYGVVLPEEMYLYVLGLLNSKLLDWYLRRVSSTFRGGWFSYESRFISKLPIRCTDLANPSDKASHDQISKLVDSILTLHKQLAVAKSQQQKVVIQRQIDATDTGIDKLVYELYGLTEEEIAIVDGKSQ